ncbi:hypothetical protein ElyMa_004662100 [Elysia marginata]|uniref:Uncharacterized protein n=1 Tax=Elysia marginata TaxID=1093978 RepID=A0AAV4I457_9GAST|nr:hypothetical protein ElyMa_004662100 [Elysia marginata]
MGGRAGHSYIEHYECKGVFDGRFQEVSLRNFTIILDFAAEHSSAVDKVLKTCLVKMVEVARRQLAEFLDEDKYAGELYGDLRKELENRPNTLIWLESMHLVISTMTWLPAGIPLCLTGVQNTCGREIRR